MALQHLRSSTANKRPTPAGMSDGQLALNTNNASPGLFFKDSNGALVKVGPVHVGTTAPNATPGSGGSTGNAIGEQWLDTTGGTYVFKVWDGSAWRSETGTFVDVNGDVMTGALGIIAGSAGAPGLYFSGDTNTGLYSPGADQLAISTGGSGRLFVDSSGRVLVGTSSARSFFGLFGGVDVPGIQIEGTSIQGRELSITSSTSIDTGAVLFLGKQRSGTLGGNTIVQNNDQVGLVSYQASDGTKMLECARIEAFVDGTPGTNDMPGRIVLWTTADGASSPTERLRITSAGLVGVGTSAPDGTTHIHTASAGTVTANSSADDLVVENNGAGGITILTPDGSNGSLFFGSPSDAVGAAARWNYTSGEFFIGSDKAGAATKLTSGDGTTAVTIDSSQRVGIGSTTALGYKLNIYESGTGMMNALHLGSGGGTAGNGASISFGLGAGFDPTANILAKIGGIYTGSGYEGALTFHTNPNSDGALPRERARIDSSGRLLVGTSSARGNFFNDLTLSAALQVEGTSYSSSTISIVSNGLFGTHPVLVMGRSRGALASNTIVANNDRVGLLSFQGNDGSRFVALGELAAEVDGTPGANDMPGRLVFSTTADGASSPTERMRVTSDGYVRLTSSSPGIQFNGDTAAANALDDYEEGTFTPSIVGTSTAGTATYGTNGQQGRYTKIGNRVFFDLYLAWSAHTGTGDLQINGLPFTVQNTTNLNRTFSAIFSSLTLTAGSIGAAFSSPNTTTIALRQLPTGGGSVATVPMDTSAQISISGSFDV